MYLWARTGPDTWDGRAEEGLRELPALLGAPHGVVRSWESPNGQVAVRWISDVWDAGGDVVRARTARDHAILVAGRPILWTGDLVAEGVDADSFTVGPAGAEVRGVPLGEADLDGRFCVVVAGNDGLLVVTDPLGQVPVHHRASGSPAVLSNVAPLVSADDDVRSARSAADFLLTGHSPRRLPLNAALRTLPSGSTARFSADGRLDVVRREIAVSDLRGVPDAQASAAHLRSAVRAMIERGSRTPVVQLTGGFDSRLVLAAARQEVEALAAVTLAFEGEAGYPYTSDVELSRVLAELVSATHDVDFRAALDGAGMDRLRALAGGFGPGTVSLQDLPALLTAPSPGSVFLNGVGGELGRDAFRVSGQGRAEQDDPAQLAATLIRVVVPDARRPVVRPELLADLRDWFEGEVQRDLDAGFAPREIIGKLVLGYAGSWHGSKAGMFDAGHEACSPLLARPLWRHFASQPDADRRVARLQRSIVRELDPRLDEVPYGSRSMVYPDAAERARDRSWIQHRRRLAAVLSGFSARGTAAVEDLQRRVRDLAEARPDLVDELLDTRRLEVLLTMDVGRADYEDRSQLWRLWSVLG